jgi:hypothetical protein
LNYLRGCKLDLPGNRSFLTELLEECKFYQLEGLQTIVKEKMQQRDVIIVEQRFGKVIGTIDLGFLKMFFRENSEWKSVYKQITWHTGKHIMFPYEMSQPQKATLFQLLLQIGFELRASRVMNTNFGGEFVFTR